METANLQVLVAMAEIVVNSHYDFLNHLGSMMKIMTVKEEHEKFIESLIDETSAYNDALGSITSDMSDEVATIREAIFATEKSALAINKIVSAYDSDDRVVAEIKISAKKVLILIARASEKAREVCAGSLN